MHMNRPRSRVIALTFENTGFLSSVSGMHKIFFLLLALIDFPTGLLSAPSRWPEIPTVERSKERSMVKVSSGSLFTFKITITPCFVTVQTMNERYRRKQYRSIKVHLCI